MSISCRSRSLFHRASLGDPVQEAASINSGVIEAEILEGHVGHFGPASLEAADHDGNVGVDRRLLESEPGGEVAVGQRQRGLQFGHCN